MVFDTLRFKSIPVWLPLVANGCLFLTSLLLLIDFAPRDYFPGYNSRRNAVEALREAENILGPLPPGITVKGETPDFRITSDPNAFKILCDLIRERATLAHAVNWPNAVGVGFSAISLPVGPAKLEAFHPLYVVELPSSGGSTFVLKPVGQFSDLNMWLTSWRQSSVTNTALLCLFAGFLLQLAEAFLKWRLAVHDANVESIRAEQYPAFDNSAGDESEPAKSTVEGSS